MTLRPRSGQAAELPDHDDRLLIREELDQTVVVEAAAGTGKTTELVARILNVLASGRARIEQIVAVTFTEKAAGELKLRIRKELEGLRNGRPRPGSPRLTDAIQRLEEAHVSTIHGFCADLLRERPVEACIDPLFEVLTEPRAERIFDEAFRVWLSERLEDPPEGVRRALRRSVWSRDGRDNDDGPIDRIRRAGRELAEWRDFDGAWRRDPFERDTELARVLTRVHDLAALTAQASSTRDPLFYDTRFVRDLSHEVRTAERFDVRDPDGWEARVVDLALNRDFRRARRGRDRLYGPLVSRDELWAAYEALTNELDAFQRAADGDLAALLREELRDVVTGYEALKRSAGALDFLDLLLRARDLLVTHPVCGAVPRALHPPLRRRVSGHRSPQAEILRLSAEARNRLANHAPGTAPVHRRRSETGDLSLPQGRRNPSGRVEMLVSRGARQAHLHQLQTLTINAPSTPRSRRT